MATESPVVPIDAAQDGSAVAATASVHIPRRHRRSVNKFRTAQTRRRSNKKLPYWMTRLVWLAAVLLFMFCSFVTLLIGSRFTTVMHLPWGISVAVSIVFEFVVWQPLVLTIMAFVQVYWKLKDLSILSMVQDPVLPI